MISVNAISGMPNGYFVPSSPPGCNFDVPFAEFCGPSEEVCGVIQSAFLNCIDSDDNGIVGATVCVTDKPMELFLTNLSGEIIHSAKLKAGTNFYSIDMSGQLAGVYILHLIGGKEPKTRKLFYAL